MTSTTLTLNVHDTPDVIFDTLARVFPVTERDASRWVTLNTDGVAVTFFADEAPTDEPVPA